MTTSKWVTKLNYNFCKKHWNVLKQTETVPLSTSWNGSIFMCHYMHIHLFSMHQISNTFYLLAKAFRKCIPYHFYLILSIIFTKCRHRVIEMQFINLDLTISISYHSAVIMKQNNPISYHYIKYPGCFMLLWTQCFKAIKQFVSNYLRSWISKKFLSQDFTAIVHYPLA